MKNSTFIQIEENQSKSKEDLIYVWPAPADNFRRENNYLKWMLPMSVEIAGGRLSPKYVQCQV